MTHSPDSIAKYVCDSFHTNSDKARAIFIWMAWNIDYDIDNMFAINFYEKKEDIIAKPLRQRKGICNNYAELFNDICNKAGIKCYVVIGYTRQNGFADYIPHAWCAAMIDTAWYLFDPTWGSGYCSEGRFHRQINEEYFKSSPWLFIRSHMPFDPMWEFLNYPVTNQEFYEGRTQLNTAKKFFDYADSIAVYEKADKLTQLNASADRITANGVKNAMIFDMLAHIKMDIANTKIEMENEKSKKEYDRQSKMVDIYNKASTRYSDGAMLFNQFIDYRNKLFTPLKTDAQIQAMIDTVVISFEEARISLGEVKDPPANIISMAEKLAEAIKEGVSQLDVQRKWLKDYFSRPRSSRKYAFYTNITTLRGR